MAQRAWTIDAYETAAGERLVQVFIPGLGARDRDEAFALVKLLEEQGNALKRPHSGALGGGLFELRGRQVRIFYMFLPDRIVVLLAGVIKKRDAIPDSVLRRLRGYQKEVLATRSRKT